MDDQRPRTSNILSLSAVALATLLLPLGILGILIHDFLSVAERLGLHLVHGEQMIVFEHYYKSRVVFESLLESLPQAMFQTGLYILGSSRATRIYIDQRIFVQSIVIALITLLMQYCTMLWEAIVAGKSLARVFLDRCKGAGQPILVLVPSKTNKDREELVETNADGL
jgi:hypothetical protein